MTGPALGRPPKAQEKRRETCKQKYQVICDRKIVEGEFGVGKRSYGLNRIMAHLPETSFCVIGIAVHESGKETAVSFAPFFRKNM